MGILPSNVMVKGEIIFRGISLTRLSDEAYRQLRGKDIALIFQDPMTRLNPLMTIEDHFVEEIQAHEPVSSDEARSRAVEALVSM
jgi:ABC-type microcin C transport system duplicated ATPase subunit YejF